MPIICEDIVDNPQIEKAAYIHTNTFINAYPSPNPIATHFPLQHVFKPTVLTAAYKRIANEIENFTVHPDDTWIVTYPKCGTTWTQAMVWLLNNNLNYELEKQSTLLERFPFLEYISMFNVNIHHDHDDDDDDDDDDDENEKNIDSINVHNSVFFTSIAPRPRNIKSHLPAGLLPKQLWTVKPTIIYVARNPKDVAVSYYHHYRNLHGYKRDFNDFMELFLNDLIVSSPFHQHLLEFWLMRNEPNILFLTYEDMQRDHLAIIKKTANFLGKNSYTEEQLIELRNHLTVDAMRLNDSSNHSSALIDHTKSLGFEMPDSSFQFIRRGKTGTFLDEMSPELIKRFDDWTANALKNSDFKFLT